MSKRAIAEDVQKNLSRGNVRWRIERRETERLPEMPREARPLAVGGKQCTDGDIVRKPEVASLQRANEVHRGEPLAPRRPFGKQNAKREVQRRWKRKRFEPEVPVDVPIE